MDFFKNYLQQKSNFFLLYSHKNLGNVFWEDITFINGEKENRPIVQIYKNIKGYSLFLQISDTKRTNIVGSLSIIDELQTVEENEKMLYGVVRNSPILGFKTISNSKQALDKCDIRIFIKRNVIPKIIQQNEFLQ